MTSSEDYSGDAIAEIKSDAHAISGQTLFSVEEYGKKWYERGVEAGLAQATEEAEDIGFTFPPENHEETINSLTAENDDLKRQVKRLKAYKDTENDELERHVQKLEAYKDIALHARNSLDSIAVNTAKLLSIWNGGSLELLRKLLELDAQAQGFREECHRKMDKASGKP